MKNYPREKIRNIGVVAHGGAGKTSLVEAMLYNTGAITRLGRIEDGTTTADYHPEEINRKITIHLSLVPCEWLDCKLNVLDTPGYADFIGEVYSALRVVDTALFVVSAVDGVEVQTEVIWEYAARAGLPALVFVNKMDRENANFFNVLTELKNKLKANFAPVQLPVGQATDFAGIVDLITQKAYTYPDNGINRQEVPVPDALKEAMANYREKLIEAAVEADDELMLKYLEGEELSNEEIFLGLKKGIAQAKVVPVLCGAATKNMGVTNLMDILANYYPAPAPANNAPFSALVFKTLADPYVGKMNFIRVYKGALKNDMQVYNSTKEKTEKIGQILYIRGKNSVPTPEVPAGDIAVLVKLQHTTTANTLCEKDKGEKLEGITFPKPALSVAISPKSKGDEDKLGNALSRLLEEDLTVQIEKNLETKENILTGMGELHLEIILERLKRKYGVDVSMEPPKIPYRETIRKTVTMEGKYKKQTGGHGQYGHVWLRLEPSAEGEFEFTEEIFGGAVPRQYIPGAEKGVRESLAEGVLVGYPVTGLKVILYDGSYHPVDSSEMAFKIAAAMAFKKGVQNAAPALLEPIMYVEVTVPENFMGDVISDLNTKRGRVLGMESTGNKTVVKATAPLAELTRYAIDLKSITQGRGSYEMKFNSYEEVPARLMEEIIKKAKEKKMIKVGIIGATGYTGAELVRLLSQHPQVELVALTTQQYVGLPFTEVYPHLSGKVNLVGEELNIPALVAKCEAVFVSLPHGHALPVAQEIIRQGKKVIDLGADLRLKDPAAYAKWYQVDLDRSLGRTITAQLLAQAVYGLPELHRQEIKQAKAVANPGCYPTSALLGLAPLLTNNIIDQNRIIIDAKSGVSGAGRGASINTHYCEVNENIKAYSVTNHRHTPEIEQELSLLAGGEIKVTFTPHLTPMTRGILSTIYAPLSVNVSSQEILNLYRTFYQGEHFIRIMPPHILPGTKMVTGSNYCALGIVVDERTNQVIILSAIDNLIKGASGQAVQNMNIMFGFPETTALEEAGVYP